MKKGRLIARIFLYTMLLVAIAATIVAVVVLKSPGPPIQSEDPGEFASAIADATGSIIGSRNRALDDLDRLRMAGITAVPAGLVLPGHSTGFGQARILSTGMLDSDAFAGSSGIIPGRLLSWPEIDENLDEADLLYGQSVTERTSALVPFFTEELNSQADIHLRLIGYRKLVSTLGRDLIRYRGLNSLRFHDIKTRIYTNEVDALSTELESMREASHVRAAEIVAGIESRYDILLADLVDEISRSIATGEPSIERDTATAEILGYIKNRVAGFRSVDFRYPPGIAPPVFPNPDRIGWLTEERELSDTVAGVSGIRVDPDDPDNPDNPGSE